MGRRGYVIFILFLQATDIAVIGQNMPLFIGQSTPPVPQFGMANPNIQFLPPNQNLTPQFMSPQGSPSGQHAEPWAPGEPMWFFPSNREQWMRSCQRLGCSGLGNHCVFWGSLCPSSVRRVPCQCQRGCRVDTNFIPFGQSRVMDSCNNVCTCMSREGTASCTTRRC